MFDGKAFGEEMVVIVKGHVDRAIAPLLTENADLKARIKAIEDRPAPEALEGTPSKDVDPEAVQEMIVSAVADAVAALPPPVDGKDAAGIVEVLKDEGELVLALQDGRLLRTGIRDGVNGKDGRDGTDGKDGANGNNGVGLAGALIDRAGHLRVRMSDGTDHDLGPVVGKDGQNGAAGKDGRDGMGPEDIGVELMDDGRTVRLAFSKGEYEYTFQIPFPVVLDRGVFTEGKAYETGDAVTWGGSLWIAQRDTSSKPDGADSGWRLAVKRGRDGKSAGGQ